MSQGTERKRKHRYLSPGQKLLLVVVLVVLFAVSSTVFLDLSRMDEQERPPADGSGWDDSVMAYVIAKEGETTAPFYNEGFAVVDQCARGTDVELESWEPYLTESNEEYYHVYLNGQFGYLRCENVTDDRIEILQENRIYARCSVHLLQNPGEPQLGSLVDKGSLLRLTGYDYFREDGSVNMYQVKLGDEFGWIKSEYVALSFDDAMSNWTNDSYSYNQHVDRGDHYGAGNAADLDYFPHEKGDFADMGNVMPESVYAMYISADDTSPSTVEQYLEAARGTAVNAFVVTLMDNQGLAYASPWLAGYSIGSEQYTCFNQPEDFAQSINMLKQAGYYVIARISAFDDVTLAKLHPEWSISDSNGEALMVDDSYWPSPYCRDVWQLKVGLAVEAVEEFGFNEVQFDYVRFPHFIPDTADLKNTLNESKAQALQRFLTYACDVLHSHGVYVSSTMFCETANDYVAPCGQYWPALSTVVDVICGQPYPKDFGSYWKDGRRYRQYEHPYETLNNFALHVVDRQKECSSPAIVRTWIQTQDVYSYRYEEMAIMKQIVALYDADITGGYMLWHPQGNLYVLDDIGTSIDHDYTDLYEKAKAENKLLSAYMNIPTANT